jgi:hypothetical protein
MAVAIPIEPINGIHSELCFVITMIGSCPCFANHREVEITFGKVMLDEAQEWPKAD